MSDTSQGDGWWLASDGKWYPPAQNPANQPPPPPDQQPATVVVQQKSNTGKIIGILALVFCVLPFLAILAIFALGDSADDDTSSSADSNSEPATEAPAGVDGAADEIDDVTITSCAVDSVGWMGVEVEVTNNSSKRSTYSIDIAFESADGATRYGEAFLFVDNVEPDQTALEEGSALEDAPDAEFTCRVVDVERTAST